MPASALQQAHLAPISDLQPDLDAVSRGARPHYAPRLARGDLPLV